MHQAEFTLNTADGLNLFGRVTQPPDEPLGVVCIIHGSGEHGGRFVHLAEVLGQAGFVAMSVDLRGHGNSEGPRGHSPSYETLLDDIALLVDKAMHDFGNPPLFLFGHSCGGNLVLNYVFRRRPALAGAVVTAPLLRSGSPTPAWKLTFARMFYSLWPSCKFNTGVSPEDKTHDLVVLKAISNDPLGHKLISARMGLDVLEAGEWALKHAGEFNIPLLLMQGDGDRVVSVDANVEFAGNVPGDCTLKIWDGLYHELHNEPEHEEVFNYTVDWLKAHLSIS